MFQTQTLVFKFLLLQLFVLFLLLIPCECQTNYCAADLCNGKKHIACNNDGSFYKSCPKNARMFNLKPYRGVILHRHNQHRNTIAGGKLRGYNAAGRMATMKWSNELARIAAYNVKQCRMKHDKCRNTKSFHFSGQNLIFKQWTGRSSGNHISKELFRELVSSFFNEYKDGNMKIIRSYAETRKPTGHFTVMVNDKNTHVGCAASEYGNNRQTAFLMACNYARTNILGRPVYTEGKAASQCKTGRHKTYKSLCSTTEKYDVNMP